MSRDRQHIIDAHRRNIRWYILKIADLGRRHGVAETTVLRALTDSHLSPSPNEVRDEMVYLEDCGFLKLDRDGPQWGARITATGMDVVNYDADCPKGIGRPPLYAD